MKKSLKMWVKPKIRNLIPTKWQWMVSHPKLLQLGKNTDIGAFSYLQAQCGIIIGDGVQIGSHCAIYSKSTIDNKEGAVRIMDNAKIGSHTTIMPGVTIGENTIIGACSFVTKDIQDNCVAYGVPCKVVKRKVHLKQGYIEVDNKRVWMREQ